MIFSGLDLGQTKDSSTLAVLDRIALDKPTPKRRWRYEVRWLQAWQLGTSYPAIVSDVAKLYERPQLERTHLVADITGVGRPVFDMLKASRVRAALVPVLTTGGQLPHLDKETGGWSVPKRDMVATLQVLLQGEFIKWSAKLPLASRFERELSEFRVTITKARNETYGAAASQHDDLVFAVMLAAWLGERDGGGLQDGIGVDDGSLFENAPREVFEGAAGLAGRDPRRFG